MTTHWRPGTLAALLAAAILLAGCTGQVAPTPSSPSSPSAPASPQPSEPASPSPQPSAPTAVGWEAATVPDTMNASGAITIVPGGEGLVAIGFNGQFGSILWTSADGGRTWTDITPADFASVGIASVVEFDGRLVGVGRGDTINVDANQAAAYVSEDGVSWRPAESAGGLEGQLIDVIATDDGLYAVGGVPGADAAGIWHSPDGETWQRTGGDFEHAFMWSIAEGGPGLVAVGWRRTPDPSVAVWTSTDGVEWSLSPDPEGFEMFEATDVIDLDGTLVMVGSSFASQGGRIWFSQDGVDWQLAEVAGGMDGVYARTVTVTPAGLIAVGGGEEMAGTAWLSSDGRSWQPLGQRLPGAFFNQAYATEGGLLVAGATQAGTLESGIRAHAQIWSATLSD